jgi:hypothetical protein
MYTFSSHYFVAEEGTEKERSMLATAASAAAGSWLPVAVAAECDDGSCEGGLEPAAAAPDEFDGGKVPVCCTFLRRCLDHIS